MIVGFIEVLIIVIFGVLLILALYLLGVYNKLCFYKNKLEDKYQTLNEEITKISNITEKVADIVKEMYGEDKIQDVKIVNRNLMGNTDVNERMHRVVGLIKFLKFISDHIQDSDKLKEYENEVVSSLDNIRYATEFYNNCVNDYNEYREKGIASYIFKIFKFKEYNKCNIVENADRL